MYTECYNNIRCQDNFKDNLNDTDLIQHYKAGDENAEITLYRAYIPIIKNIISAYYIVGADEDDLLQEGMLGLHKAAMEYDSNRDCSFKTYACLCIRRNIITAIRDINRKKHSILNNYISLDKDYEQDYFIIDDKSSSPEEILLDKEKRYGVIKEINKCLTELEKKVFVLFYYYGLSYHSISTILHKDEKSIDNTLQRIKHKMKYHLKIYR